MNYQIIKYRALLKEFIDWLPELKQNEKYYISLFARKKYATGLTDVPGISDKSQLKRFTSTKERMLQKIMQLECPVGSYEIMDGLPAPQDALALYIGINPVNQITASTKLLRKLLDKVLNYKDAKDKPDINPYQLALTELHRATGTKHFMDFDIDFIDENATVETYISAIDKYINTDAYHILRTHGGIHVLVEMGRVAQNCSKSWYHHMLMLAGVDVTGTNTLLPVPGCVQGQFVPYFEKHQVQFREIEFEKGNPNDNPFLPICMEKECPHMGECANHTTAGDFRSEGGQTPNLQFKSERILCDREPIAELNGVRMSDGTVYRGLYG